MSWRVVLRIESDNARAKGSLPCTLGADGGYALTLIRSKGGHLHVELGSRPGSVPSLGKSERWEALVHSCCFLDVQGLCGGREGHLRP